MLVRFKPGATDQARHQVHNAIGATQLRAYRNVDGLVLVRVSPDQLQQAHAAYVGDQRILYAEPDYAIGNNGIGVVVDAMDYTVTNNIKVSNHSWGTVVWSQALYDAIAESQSIGHILVASAGNNRPDNDTSPHYPSNYALPNVIGVAATDNDDNLADEANWGSNDGGPA